MGVCRLRGDGRVEYANRQALELLDVPEDLLVGLDPGISRWMDRSEVDTGFNGRVADAYRSIANGAERVSDFEYVTPGGVVRWLDLRIRRLGDVRSNRDGHIVTIEDVTDKRLASARLVHQATHDQLTGLPNRRLLLESLAAAMDRAEEEGRLLAVLFCDLDLFKVVNGQPRPRCGRPTAAGCRRPVRLGSAKQRDTGALRRRRVRGGV